MLNFEKICLTFFLQRKCCVSFEFKLDNIKSGPKKFEIGRKNSKSAALILAPKNTKSAAKNSKTALQISAPKNSKSAPKKSKIGPKK